MGGLRTAKARYVAYIRSVLPVLIPFGVLWVVWEGLDIPHHRGDALGMLPVCMVLALPFSRAYRRSLRRTWNRSSGWRRAIGVLVLVGSVFYVAIGVLSAVL